MILTDHAMTATEVLARMSLMEKRRRAFRNFWLTQMVPVLLQLPLSYGEVYFAQHKAWARWREVYDS